MNDWNIPSSHAHKGAMGFTNRKLGLWLLLGSECMTFGSAIATYLFYHDRLNGGPGPVDIFDIPFTTASTFVLLMSSLAMVLALDAVEKKNIKNFRIWVMATALMGGIFLAGQIYEFTAFVNEGMAWWTSPFSASFFTLTTFHGAHVAFGVSMLLMMFFMSFTPFFHIDDSEPIELVGLFWHFVDIVWILIFTLIYLIPVT